MKDMKLFKYYVNSNLEFEINNNEFVSFMGNGNKKIIDNITFKSRNNFISLEGNSIDKSNYNEYRSKIGFALNENLNIFTSETVEDELAYALENLGIKSSVMHENIIKYSVKYGLDEYMNEDPRTIGSSKKAVVKIISCLLYKPKVLVLDNILCELDKSDKRLIVNELIEFVKAGNIVLNFTSDIEDTLYGNYIILTDIDKIIASGKTIPILKEEKLMNRLGLSLPFMFDLNKQLMYYELLDEYVMDIEGLVDRIWK